MCLLPFLIKGGNASTMCCAIAALPREKAAHVPLGGLRWPHPLSIMSKNTWVHGALTRIDILNIVEAIIGEANEAPGAAQALLC